ncbi:MAG: TonB-dependent receptor [Pseudomonadota bacterium]
MAQDGIGLEEIFITAQRRSESLQDTPLAVSAFGVNDLEVRNIDSALDLIDYIPNLFGGNNTGLGSANAYYLRGLGNTESIATFDPPVGTYIDDIYISRQNANNFSFFDLDRIEVLRGPQGTLFGRNTTGGAINVLLREPDEEFGGFAEVSYGRFERITARASVDIPINEQLSTKVSGYFIDDAGYAYNFELDERVNDERSYGLRGAVKWTPNEYLNWNVSATYVNSDVANLANSPIDGDNVEPSARNANTVARFNASGATTGLNRIAGGFLSMNGDVGNSLGELLAGQGGGNVVKNLLLASNLEVSFDKVNVEIITGWVDLDQDFVLNFLDGDLYTVPIFNGVTPAQVFGNPGPSSFSIANDSTHKQFSQEIKATGDLFDGFIDYVAGVYFLDERNTTGIAQFFLGTSYDRVLGNDTTAGAGYVQLDWNLTEKLTFTTGIRYTDETKTLSIEDLGTGPSNCSTVIPGQFDMDEEGAFILDDNGMMIPSTVSRLCSTNDITAAGIPTKLNTSILTPRFAVQYEVNDDVLLFASATRGFKSGAWNARDAQPQNLVNIDPEVVWSYEIGAKTQFFDDRLRLNVTGFYSDVSDLQTPSAFTNAAGETVFITGNFADLRVMGIEAEATAVVNEYITTFLTIGFQDSDYRNLDSTLVAQQAQCRANLQDQGVDQLFDSSTGCQQAIIGPDGEVAEPVRAPRVTMSLGANGNYPISDNLQITASAFGIYTSSYQTATNGELPGAQDGFWRFNGNVGVEHVDGDYGLYLECQNCFGENYIISALVATQYYNPPGSWTLRARYRF